jgi:hypothetical protein
VDIKEVNTSDSLKVTLLKRSDLNTDRRIEATKAFAGFGLRRLELKDTDVFAGIEK